VLSEKFHFSEGNRESAKIKKQTKNT